STVKACGSKPLTLAPSHLAPSMARISLNLLVVWETSPKLNQTVLFIYISHPKPPHSTNFQNQIHLDFIIISAKPYSNPRFHPATASGGCSVNALLTRCTVRANRAA